MHNICRKFITNVPHVHNIASQTMGDFSKSPINEYSDLGYTPQIPLN